MYTTEGEIMNKINTAFLMLLIFFRAANASNILVFDDFNRPDSNILWNGWVEENEKEVSEYIGDILYLKGHIAIDSNRMSFIYNAPQNYTSSKSTSPYVLKMLGREARFPLSYSFTYEPSQDARVYHEIGLIDSVGGMISNGDGAYVPYNGVSIFVGRSSKKSSTSSLVIAKYESGMRTSGSIQKPPFQFNFGTKYYFTVEIVDSENMNVTVSGGGNDYSYSEKLSIAGLVLDQFAVYDIQGGVSYDSMGAPGDFYVSFDDITLVDTSSYTVQIDIVSGGGSGCINNDGNGSMPVTIFSTDLFDASNINPASVKLDSMPVKLKGNGTPISHLEDINGDGLLDLVVQVQDVDGVYEPGNATATLTGVTYDDVVFEGVDNICVR